MNKGPQSIKLSVPDKLQCAPTVAATRERGAASPTRLEPVNAEAGLYQPHLSLVIRHQYCSYHHLPGLSNKIRPVTRMKESSL